MDIGELLALGLGLLPPWKLVGQRVDTSKQPHEVYWEVPADRGAEYPCPECDRVCKARDFQEFIWRHLNILQYHCYVTGRTPRVDCPDYGTSWTSTHSNARLEGSTKYSRPPGQGPEATVTSSPS